MSRELTAAEVRRLRAAQPSRVPPMTVAALAWVLLVVVSTVLEVEGGCTPDVPCGPDWVGALEVTLAFAAPCLLLWVPQVGAWVSVAALAVFAVVEPSLGDQPPAVTVVLVVAVVAGLLWGRATSRRASARIDAALVGVPRGTWPLPAPPSSPWWRTGLAAGGLLAIAAVLLLAAGVVRGGQQAQAESRAAQEVATVVAHGDDGYLITVEVQGSERRAEIDTLLASDYPVGSEQPVLVAPGFVRLVAEPYDPAGYLAAALATGLLGLAVWWRSADRRRRTAALWREPQPQWQVRVAAFDGAVVLPADDLRGAGPALVNASVRLFELAPDGSWLVDGEADEDEEEWRGSPFDDDQQRSDEPLPAALLHGVPVVDHVVALVLAEGALFPDGRVGRIEEGWELPFLDAFPDAPAAELAALHVDPPGPHDGAGAADASLPDEATDRVLAPEPWRGQLGGLVVAACLLAVVVALTAIDAPVDALQALVPAVVIGLQGLATLAFRIESTDEALVVHSALRTRRLPWAGLSGASAVDGVVLLLDRDGDVAPLTTMSLRWGRKGNREARAREVAALLQHRIVRARSAPGFVHPQGVQERVESRVVLPAFAVAVTLAVATGVALRALG